MKKILIIVLLAAGGVMFAQTTTRKALRAEEAEIAPVAEETSVVVRDYDTIVSPPPSMVDITGYDKPLRSRRETFFVTNSGRQPIGSIAYTINYYDTRQRQLHSASHRQNVDVPVNQTRQLGMRSWDNQQSFYYIRSAVPQRAQQATPYEVTITVDTIFVVR